MRLQGNPLGVIQVFNKKPAPEFAPEDEDRLQMFADQAAMAIERLRLNERLQAENRRIRGIFEALTDGIMVVDPEGNPLLYNKAIEDLFFPRGKQNYSLTTYLSTLVKRGTTQAQAEVVLFKPHEVVLSNRLVVIRDPSGTPSEVVVSIRNITDQRALDRRFSQFFAIMLRKADRMLRRSRRLKGRKLRLQLERIIKLSRNFVFLTELRSGPLRIEKESCQFVELYKKVRTRFLGTFRKAGIDFRDEECLLAGPCRVRAQIPLLKEVFLTLFTKARRTLGKGGTIQSVIRHDAGRVFFTATLSGQGIREAINPECLDWNLQVDRILKGESKILDLELAFSGHIIQAHKGRVDICETGEHAVMIQFDLPLDEERDEE